MTAADHAVPGRLSVLRSSAAYAPDGPLHLYAEQLTRACATPGEQDRVAVPRPVSAAYPVVTASFARAVDTDVRVTGYALPGG